MQIMRYTDYALRVLIYLVLYRAGLYTIHDIATRYRISENHLMKIIHDLGNRQYLQATRGKRGGLRLNRAPHAINIGGLVRALADQGRFIECLDHANPCLIARPVC